MNLDAPVVAVSEAGTTGRSLRLFFRNERDDDDDAVGEHMDLTDQQGQMLRLFSAWCAMGASRCSPRCCGKPGR